MSVPVYMNEKIIISCIRGRDNIIGLLCLSACLYVCLWVLSRLKIRWKLLVSVFSHPSPSSIFILAGDGPIWGVGNIPVMGHTCFSMTWISPKHFFHLLYKEWPFSWNKSLMSNSAGKPLTWEFYVLAWNVFLKIFSFDLRYPLWNILKDTSNTWIWNLKCTLSLRLLDIYY